jgi:hypothetical protein
VLIPTVKSLLAAIKQYEEHGGSASIYVNDDGMQLIEETVAQWVSKPSQTSTVLTASP